MQSKYQYVLCPARYPANSHAETYKKIYDCWNLVWSQAFQELHGDVNLESDNFTRQDFIGAIFMDGECVAMSLFRHMDANSSTLKRDSYFSNWSEIHIAKLCSNGPRILVCSHFTIHPKARGSKSDDQPAVRDLLTGLSIMVIKNSKADAMTGAMRKNRNVHKLTYDWGSEKIASDISSGHGDFVDLIMMSQKTPIEGHPTYPIVENLWNERLVIPQELPELIEDYIAGNQFSQTKKAS